MLKKRSITIIIFLLIAGLSVSCIYFLLFFDKQNESASNEEVDQEIVELTFWRNYGTKPENEAFQALISSFQEKHPTIKIKVISIPFSDYETRLRTEIVAGNVPDIMTIDSPNLALYAESNVLLSLNDWMHTEGNIEDIPEATLKGLTYKDELFLAPIAESGIALFYNKKIFEKAGVPVPSSDPTKPLTWEQVLELAKKLNNPEEGIYGIDPAQGFSDGEGPAYFKIPLIWQFGGDILDEDATTATGFLNSEKSLEAYRFFQTLYQEEKVASIELPESPFENGHLAMVIFGSWALKELEMNRPDFKLGEDFGVAPLPVAEKRVVPNGGWAIGISKKTNHPKEAWEFVKYVSSYEGVKKYVEITGDIPARFSVADEIKELNEYPKNIFVQQAQHFSKNRPITPAYPVVSEEIKKLFEEIGIKGEDVKVAADEAVERINKELTELNE